MYFNVEEILTMVLVHFEFSIISLLAFCHPGLVNVCSRAYLHILTPHFFPHFFLYLIEPTLLYHGCILVKNSF